MENLTLIEKIAQYNKRCALFLGWYFENGRWLKLEPLNGGVIAVLKCDSDSNLKFHSDWNLIIEVVEAIEKVNFTKIKNFSCFEVVIKGNRCIIEQHPQLALVFEKMCDNFHNKNPFVVADSKKEAIVQAIDNFLIWHNEQTNKTRS